MRETLGILVNSSNHPDYVIQLARAARERRRQVRIHFAGPGVRLVTAESMDELSQLARISVCRHSASAHGLLAGLGRLKNIRLDGNGGMANLLDECDRVVVF